jgi:hypothetical protein
MKEWVKSCDTNQSKIILSKTFSADPFSYLHTGLKALVPHSRYLPESLSNFFNTCQKIFFVQKLLLDRYPTAHKIQIKMFLVDLTPSTLDSN